MRLSTVNVIEYADDAVLSIRSFNDNEKGNKKAEKLFKSIMKERDDDAITEEDIEACIENGYYDEGNYGLFLAHSS
jgi:hypothetical protein